MSSDPIECSLMGRVGDIYRSCKWDMEAAKKLILSGREDTRVGRGLRLGRASKTLYEYSRQQQHLAEMLAALQSEPSPARSRTVIWSKNKKPKKD